MLDLVRTGQVDEVFRHSGPSSSLLLSQPSLVIGPEQYVSLSLDIPVQCMSEMLHFPE
jgi:hypothetical protein